MLTLAAGYYDVVKRVLLHLQCNGNEGLRWPTSYLEIHSPAIYKAMLHFSGGWVEICYLLVESIERFSFYYKCRHN